MTKIIFLLQRFFLINLILITSIICVYLVLKSSHIATPVIEASCNKLNDPLVLYSPLEPTIGIMMEATPYDLYESVTKEVVADLPLTPPSWIILSIPLALGIILGYCIAMVTKDTAGAIKDIYTKNNADDALHSGLEDMPNSLLLFLSEPFILYFFSTIILGITFIYFYLKLCTIKHDQLGNKFSSRLKRLFLFNLIVILCIILFYLLLHLTEFLVLDHSSIGQLENMSQVENVLYSVVEPMYTLKSFFKETFYILVGVSEIIMLISFLAPVIGSSLGILCGLFVCTIDARKLGYTKLVTDKTVDFITEHPYLCASVTVAAALMLAGYSINKDLNTFSDSDRESELHNTSTQTPITAINQPHRLDLNPHNDPQGHLNSGLEDLPNSLFLLLSEPFTTYFFSIFILLIGVFLVFKGKLSNKILFKIKSFFLFNPKLVQFTFIISFYLVLKLSLNPAISYCSNDEIIVSWDTGTPYNHWERIPTFPEGTTVDLDHRSYGYPPGYKLPIKIMQPLVKINPLSAEIAFNMDIQQDYYLRYPHLRNIMKFATDQKNKDLINQLFDHEIYNNFMNPLTVKLNQFILPQDSPIYKNIAGIQALFVTPLCEMFEKTHNPVYLHAACRMITFVALQADPKFPSMTEGDIILFVTNTFGDVYLSIVNNSNLDCK